MSSSEAKRYWVEHARPALKALMEVCKDDGTGVESSDEMHNAIDTVFDAMTEFQEFVYDMESS